VRGASIVFAAALFASLGCNEKKQPPLGSRSALADSADQVMWGAKFNLTDKGLQRAELNADTAFFFNDNTRIELRHVFATFFTAGGAKDATLASDAGTYSTRTGSMFARQHVVVISEDGRRLETPELAYDQTRNEISGDSAFVLTEPNSRLEGIGFRSDPNLNNIHVLRAATGYRAQSQTAPPPSRGSSTPVRK
jgi:LPS export ABC transporter protein LptC